jgi:hypothetical protein
MVTLGNRIDSSFLLARKQKCEKFIQLERVKFGHDCFGIPHIHFNFAT